MNWKKLAVSAAIVNVFAAGFLTRGVTAERYPEVRGALRALAQAEAFLQRTEADSGGHRARAVAFIRDAQKELNYSLASDK